MNWCKFLWGNPCRGDHLSARLQSPLTGRVPSASRTHLFSAYDHGRLRSVDALTQAWLYIEPSRRFNSQGARPASDPVDGDPDDARNIESLIATTPDRAEARWGLGCVTTSGNRRSCPGWVCSPVPWIVTVFTSLACYPGAPLRPLLRRQLFGQRGDHLPLRAARFFLLFVRLTGGFCHAD